MRISDLNKEIQKCEKCKLYKTRINILTGEGNLNAKLMFIAQAPGENEDKMGKMFIGPSGKVLDELFKDASILRQEIYMTNLIKCMLPKNRKPKQDEIKTCSQYLEKEIELINPKVIAPLGYYATKYILNKYKIDMPQVKSEAFGKLFLVNNVKIFPLSHPASLIYNKSFKSKMVNDYKKLKILTQDCKWYPTCPMKHFYENGKLDKKWIENYCKGNWQDCIRFFKEENNIYHPDNMLPNGEINENLF
ncbi:MAG: uracil-DNA glycosylase [Bacteroidales bacterium]|nr:uracil-DNA glycosylase [Bacteroidales bacterium]